MEKGTHRQFQYKPKNCNTQKYSRRTDKPTDQQIYGHVNGLKDTQKDQQMDGNKITLSKRDANIRFNR